MLFWQLFSNIQKENNSTGLAFNDVVLLFAQERKNDKDRNLKKLSK